MKQYQEETEKANTESKEVSQEDDTETNKSSEQEEPESSETVIEEDSAEPKESASKEDNAETNKTSKQDESKSSEEETAEDSTDTKTQPSEQNRESNNEDTIQATNPNDNEVNQSTTLKLENKSKEDSELNKDEYEDLQNKSSNKDKTDNSLKAANVMSTKVKEEAAKEDNDAKALGGNNVNDKVKASNVKFTDGTWKKGTLNQIGFDLTIPEDVKRNDYFSVKVPKELNPTSADRDNGILLGNDENSIYAKGTYNRENNAFDFKFTDNISKYKNKTSHVDLMALINYKEATKTDNYNLKLQVGDQPFTVNRKIEYSSDARNTMVYQDSEVQEKDGNHNPYNTTYTINGQNKNLTNAKVKITPYVGSQKSADAISQFNKNTTKVTILKVNDKNSMNQSGSEKNVNTNDESKQHQVTYNSDGSINIDLGNITGPYLIKVNSETERPFVPNTFVESYVQLSANNISTQSNQSRIGKAKPSNSNSSGVVVDDTTPPTVTSINNQTKELNSPIDPVTINATDNSGKPVKNDVYGLPEGVSFNSETNTISGTPRKPGIYNVTVLSSDHVYNETKTEFAINVEDTIGPDVDQIENQRKEVNTSIDDIEIGSSDNSEGSVTHEVSGLPDGVTFDSETNRISGTPTKVGSYPITVTSKDESGNTTETNFNIIVEDNTPDDNDNGGNEPAPGDNDNGGNEPAPGDNDNGGNNPGSGDNDNGGNEPAPGNNDNGENDLVLNNTYNGSNDSTSNDNSNDNNDIISDYTTNDSNDKSSRGDISRSNNVTSGNDYNTSNISNKENDDQLPNTGEKSGNNSLNTIFGGVIAMMGSLLLFSRRKKKDND